jgi:integrase/recombinase XerD
MRISLSQLHLQKLALFSASNCHLIIRYLDLLEARNYAQGTLVLIIQALRSLALSLPESRRASVTQDFTKTTAQDLDLFVDAVKQRGLAPSTINTTLSLIREFFDYLREEGLMQIQPVIRRRHRVLAPIRLPKPMAEEDLSNFFKVIDSIRDRLIFLLMLRGGLRVSEASALTWNDIDFQAGTLRINNSKGQTDRIGYLAPDVEKSLRVWHQRRPSETYLFPAQGPRRGQQSVTLSTQQIYRLMKEYLRRAEIRQHYTPHCLRHTFATQMLNAGVTLEVLKELMGHRSVQMTLCYTQLYDSTKRQQYDRAMERIEKRQAMMGR